MLSKVLFLINPASGTQRRKNIEKMAKEILAEFAQVEIAHTQYAKHATELAKEAVQQGFDTVVAVGGDGTINETAQYLVGSETALYIIPMGSGNGLARDLGISLNPEEALEQFKKTEIRTIDVGYVNEKLFLATAGVGFEAEVSHRFAKEKSRGLKTYVKATLQSFLEYQPQKYSIKADGKTFETEAFMLTVANTMQFGNNFYVAPQADLTDGLLDLCILKPFKSYEAGLLAWQASQKNIHKNPNMETLKAQYIEIIRKNAKDTLAQIDGEPTELPAEIHIQVRPRCLKIRVPK